MQILKILFFVYLLSAEVKVLHILALFNVLSVKYVEPVNIITMELSIK